MLPLVEMPAMVRQYAPSFASVFAPEAFLQLQRDVSGLIMSETKGVEGINRLFLIAVGHQSGLNRLLTESPFSGAALNHARLELLSSLCGSQMQPRGILGLDDSLLTPYGKHFDKIAGLW